MKIQNDLIGKKVLIIHTYVSKFFRSYCTYHIATIKYYYPSGNFIIVECPDINRTRFTLIDHDDPFINKDYSDKKLAMNFSTNDGWYYVFTDESSIRQLEYNLIHYKNKRSFNSCKMLVPNGCLMTTKERKKCFETLLSKIRNEISE